MRNVFLRKLKGLNVESRSSLCGISANFGAAFEIFFVFLCPGGPLISLTLHCTSSISARRILVTGSVVFAVIFGALLILTQFARGAGGETWGVLGKLVGDWVDIS